MLCQKLVFSSVLCKCLVNLGFIDFFCEYTKFVLRKNWELKTLQQATQNLIPTVNNLSENIKFPRHILFCKLKFSHKLFFCCLLYLSHVTYTYNNILLRDTHTQISRRFLFSFNIFLQNTGTTHVSFCLYIILPLGNICI